MIKDIINISNSISKDILDIDDISILKDLNNNIITLGNSLDKEHYTKLEDNIWIGKNVYIDSYSKIIGPCIIDDNTIVRFASFIRGNVIIGKNCIIGNSIELKNSILLDNCHLSHYNYVGDSILGNNVSLGAGVILSNLKLDRSNITESNFKKLGSIIGDNTSIGCNSVLYPGTIVGRNTNIYPLVKVRGYIDSDSIMKSEDIIIKKENR